MQFGNHRFRNGVGGPGSAQSFPDFGVVGRHPGAIVFIFQEALDFHDEVLPRQVILQQFLEAGRSMTRFARLMYLILRMIRPTR